MSRSAALQEGPVSDRDLSAAWFRIPRAPNAGAATPLLDDPIADGWFR